jgi:hypothetical protein
MLSAFDADDVYWKGKGTRPACSVTSYSAALDFEKGSMKALFNSNGMLVWPQHSSRP